MKTHIKELFLALALLAGIHQGAAQETRFFRISGPAASGITAFTEWHAGLDQRAGGHELYCPDQRGTARWN